MQTTYAEGYTAFMDAYAAAHALQRRASLLSILPRVNQLILEAEEAVEHENRAIEEIRAKESLLNPRNSESPWQLRSRQEILRMHTGIRDSMQLRIQKGRQEKEMLEASIRMMDAELAGNIPQPGAASAASSASNRASSAASSASNRASSAASSAYNRASSAYNGLASAASSAYNRSLRASRASRASNGAASAAASASNRASSASNGAASAASSASNGAEPGAAGAEPGAQGGKRRCHKRRSHKRRNRRSKQTYRRYRR